MEKNGRSASDDFLVELMRGTRAQETSVFVRQYFVSARNASYDGHASTWNFQSWILNAICSLFVDQKARAWLLDG
jgi:hypothetical protein